MRRAGRHTILKIRVERWETMRRQWRRYLVLAAFLGVLASVSILMLPPLGRAFIAGVYCAMFVALVGYSLTLDGSHLRAMGAEAERWTSAELRKLDGWTVIDAVAFYDGDVDHIAVGASQTLAVETKWTSRTVTIDDRGVHGLWTDGIGQAIHSARRMERFLASKGLHQSVDPVLVLWGPGVPKIAGGYQRVGKVRMLVGPQADEWRARLARVPAWSYNTAGVPEALEAYVRTYDERNPPARGPRLLRLLGMG